MKNKSRISLILRRFWAWLICRSSSNLDPLESFSSNLNPTEFPSSNLNQTEFSSSNLNPSGSSSNLNPLGTESIASCSSIDTDSSIQNYRYDVFIGFRGTDTRNSFVDHLYSHLIRKGIFVFKDDKQIQKGECISAQLLQAIQNSQISIIVFSKNYASSTWCLDEMAAIADCKQHAKQTVFSVFYDVDPSDVRYQTGEYQNAFVSHSRNFQRDKVDRWEKAMRILANSAGWDVRNKSESEEIENIVQTVIKKLGHKFTGFVDDLIGIQPRVQALENLLKLNSENAIPILGIWGMDGIGKTTHATILYDRISHKFDACCFIENVSKIYSDGGHTAVQKQILHQTLEEKNLEIFSPSEISRIVKNRLHKIKVLIVLDNVDQLEQLQELAINPKLLSKGSRIIVTTRDEHILKLYGEHVKHKVSLLNENDARELFYRKAFKSEDQGSSCVELIPEVLKYCQCLPLAIKVMGSFLCTRDATQWRDVLDRLKTNPNDKIMNVLQISVDGLEYEDKEIFLHIACFFKGEREDYVKRILECCGLHPHIGIPRIIEKSLITIRDQEIHMHDMFQELGKKIVRDKFPEEPRSWSRLWLYEHFYHVLMAEKGTENVKAIVLDQKENISECKIDGLSKMENLSLLILNHQNFSGSLDSLSHKLRYLLWHSYPFASLPSNFTAANLMELNMPNSSIKRVWEGLKEPYFFRCGFDIVVPWGLEDLLPRWLQKSFKGDSVIRIKNFNMDDNWIGFVFCVIFERTKHSAVSRSPQSSFSSSHPFYLSFESEHTEEYFDMTLNLEMDKIDGSRHLWMIYISGQHCHFVKTEAHVTFKAQPGIEIIKWGMCSIFRQDIDKLKWIQHGEPLPTGHYIDFDYVRKSNCSYGPKIQLPYNWLLTGEDEVENINAKAKENNLCYAGL